MANTMFINHQKQSFLSGLGDKIKTGADIIGKMKTAYDVGRSIYNAGEMVSPYISAAAAILQKIIINI